jgi:hypothetical protein
MMRVKSKINPKPCSCRHRDEKEVQLKPNRNPAEVFIWSAPRSNRFNPERTATQCTGGWVGIEAEWMTRKISPFPPLGFDPQTIQRVTSRYTHYAIDMNGSYEYTEHAVVGSRQRMRLST